MYLYSRPVPWYWYPLLPCWVGQWWGEGCVRTWGENNGLDCCCLDIFCLFTGRWLQTWNMRNTLDFCSRCHRIFWLFNFGLPGLYFGHQEVEIPGGACLYEPKLHVSGGDQPWIYGGQHVSDRVKEVWWTPACDADATWTSGWQVRDNVLESSRPPAPWLQIFWVFSPSQ